MIEKAFSVDGDSITCVGLFMSCLSPYKSKISVGYLCITEGHVTSSFLTGDEIEFPFNISIVDFYLITSPSLC